MKMLVVSFLWMLIAFNGILNSSAQTRSGFLISDRNRLGVNLYPIAANLLGDNIKMPFELIYKRQAKHKKQAWRMGLLANYFLDDHYCVMGKDTVHSIGTYSVDLDNNDETRTTIVGGFAGYEWQVDVAKRWRLAYGVDARYVYAHTRHEWWKKTFILIYDHRLCPSDHQFCLSPDAQLYEYHSRVFYNTHRVSICTFLEVEFAVTRQLSVGIGINISFLYERYSASTDSTPTLKNGSPYSKNSEGLGQYAFETFDFGMSPFQQITLFYSF